MTSLVAGTNHCAPEEALPHDSDQDSTEEKLSQGSSRTSPPEITKSSSSISLALNPSESFSLLNPNSTMDEEDAPAIALLRQIFPDESPSALRALHHQRVETAVHNSVTPIAQTPDDPNRPQQTKELQLLAATPLPPPEGSSHTKPWKLPKSALGRRIYHEHTRSSSSPREWPEIELAEDFLRLPSSFAVRRTTPTSPLARGDPLHAMSPRYELISDLHHQALQEYFLVSQPSFATPPYFYSVSATPHPEVGLGLKLSESPLALPLRQSTLTSRLCVYSLTDHPENPCAMSGSIQPGDILLGMNGSALFFPRSSTPKSRMQHAVKAIRDSPHPIVLHFGRFPKEIASFPSNQGEIGQRLPYIERNASLLDASSSTQPLSSSSSVSSLASSSARQDTLYQVPSTSTNETIHSTCTHASNTPVSPRILYPSTSNGTHTPGRAQSNVTRPLVAHSPARATPHIRKPQCVHPLALALRARGLIAQASGSNKRNGNRLGFRLGNHAPTQAHDDAMQITLHLDQFNARARQWETFHSLRLDHMNHSVLAQFDQRDLPPEMDALVYGDSEEFIGSQRSNGMNSRSVEVPPSTPPLALESPLIPLEYKLAYFGPDYVDPNADEELYNHSDQSKPWLQYPGDSIAPSNVNSIFVPLFNVRKGLCTRIVNTFPVPENNGGQSRSPRVGAVLHEQNPLKTAYTIWVYDVATSKEWYAPIRYFDDFEELRRACMALAPAHAHVGEWDFPQTGPKTAAGMFFASLVQTASGNHSMTSPLRASNNRMAGSAGASSEDETTSGILEQFLRNLCGLIYTCEPLSPEIAEMSIHVQSFLGVEAGLADSTDWDEFHQSTQQRQWQNVTPKEDKSRHPETPTEKLQLDVETQWERRQELKISLQMYVYRVFLLNVMKAIVKDFVDLTRSQGPKLEEIESLEVGSKLKSRATADLGKIQAFLDHMVDLILEGCDDDLKSIAGRRYYRVLHSQLEDETYWERLVREAIREQVEIEVYVPLRSVVSRLLVNGWRHEDMEVHFKINELKKRSQSTFRIPKDKVSPSNWQSVATILKRGVGMSTLPCNKLQAIVDAAREISFLYEEEQNKGDESQELGADDFLPIFIYCVVRAEMERPCALGVLLTTLCDRMNRIGEIGYFLASFEAAIAHIQELDLTEDKGEMLSFLSSPLTEISLSD